jgi:microcystin-dependent protein
MLKFSSRTVAVLAILLCVATAHAQETRVVVIPLFGDDAASKWRGPWVTDTAYKNSEIIEFGGSSYIAVNSHTSSLANIPPDAAFWELVAASGFTGAAGPQGDMGAKGDTGSQGPRGDTGFTGSPGMTGMTGAQGPVGPQGEVGADGADGNQFPPDEITTFAKVPDPLLPNEKVISGITYSAGSQIQITTNAMNPDQKVISFAPTAGGQRDNHQPSLAVNYIIALDGIYPSRSQSTPLIGAIVMFGGNFAPRSWAFCDGQLMPISSNTALFSLLGTIYGGNGLSTFGLPDLRGRAAVHAGNGPGLPSRRLGEKFGSTNVQL